MPSKNLIKQYLIVQAMSRRRNAPCRELVQRFLMGHCPITRITSARRSAKRDDGNRALRINACQQVALAARALHPYRCMQPCRPVPALAGLVAYQRCHRASATRCQSRGPDPPAICRRRACAASARPVPIRCLDLWVLAQAGAMALANFGLGSRRCRYACGSVVRRRPAASIRIAQPGTVAVEHDRGPGCSRGRRNTRSEISDLFPNR